MVADEVKKWVAGWAKNLFHERSNHQRVSAGVASSGQPIILDREGKIDPSFIHIAPFHAEDLVVDDDVDVGGTLQANDVYINNEPPLTGPGLTVYRNQPAAVTEAPVVFIHQDHAGDDQPALRMQQDGTGHLLDLRTETTPVFVVANGGNVAIGHGAPGARLDVNGATYIRPPAAGVDNGFELHFRNYTASYKTSGTYVIGKISALAWQAWNAGFSGNNIINAAEIAFAYSANSDGRTIASKIDFSVQGHYSGALTKVATLTVDSLDLTTSLGHTIHPYGYRTVAATISGHYVNTTRLNLVAFSISQYSAVTVRVSYNQFVTSWGPDELVMGLGVVTLSHDTVAWYVGVTGYVGTQHLGLLWETSGDRCLIYLQRNSGAPWRYDQFSRMASVEIIGSLFGVVWSPVSI